MWHLAEIVHLAYSQNYGTLLAEYEKSKERHESMDNLMQKRKQHLWDAAESFNHALAQYRLERGEATQGIRRIALDLKRSTFRKVGRNPVRSLSLGMSFLAAAVVGFRLLRQERILPFHQTTRNGLSKAA